MIDLPDNAPRRDLMKFLTAAAIGGAIAEGAPAQTPVPARTLAGEVAAAVMPGGRS